MWNGRSHLLLITFAKRWSVDADKSSETIDGQCLKNIGAAYSKGHSRLHHAERFNAPGENVTDFRQDRVRGVQDIHGGSLANFFQEGGDLCFDLDKRRLLQQGGQVYSKLRSQFGQANVQLC